MLTNLPILPMGNKPFAPSLAVAEQAATAAELMANLDTELLVSFGDAATELKVTYHTIIGWANDQRMPTERHGRGRFIARDVVDQIKELHDLHGQRWWKHARWSADAPEGVAAMPLALPVDDEPTGDITAVEKALLAVSQRLMKRARELERHGEEKAALAVLWSAIEVVFEEVPK